MLFRFNHPKPVGDGKAVAMLVVSRKVAAPSCMHTIIVSDATAAPGASPPPLATSAPALTQPIQFSVSYGLREYLSFLREHATHLIKRRRRAVAGKRRTPLDIFEKPVVLNFVTAALGTPVFLLKQRRAACEIYLDDIGITRVSRTSRKSWGWNEVREVRKYTRGYLLFLPTGAVPIPYRCLDEGQRMQLRGLVSVPVAHRT